MDAKRRAEFNMTEPEVLTRLIERAKQKGDDIREDLKNLSYLSEEIGSVLINRGLVFSSLSLIEVEPEYQRCVGIDGSFQLIGGIGGKWYAPISVARVIIENIWMSQPSLDVFWADIEPIEVHEEHRRSIKATLMMLNLEAKAILSWGISNNPAYIMIDGPIVDPPFFAPIEGYKDYIADRCHAIKKALENRCRIVGCVKRSRDSFYKDYLRGLGGDSLKKVERFPTDQHLFIHIFSKLRKKGYSPPFFTKWIRASGPKIYAAYEKEGVYIITLFFQKSILSPVLRLDVPFTDPPEKIPNLDKIILSIVKTVSLLTYDGHGYPLPVFLAHEKSSIREGCAEILYSEIMTRAHTVDIEDQITLDLLW